VSFSANDLGRVVRTIWSTQLGLELEDGEPEALEAKLADRETIAAGVTFSGDFSGTLVQRCSHQASMVAASSAFAADGEEISSIEARDVLAELTNMTAGNLKAILPGHIEFSSPATIDPDEDTGSLVAEAGFELQGEPLIVKLTRRQS